MASPREVSPEFVRELAHSIESNRHDLKRALDLGDRNTLLELAKDIMAFANQHDPRDSYILVGVTDDHRVIGSEGLGIDEATLRQSLGSFYDRSIQWKLQEVRLDGTTVQVIAIGQADVRPVRFLKSESRSKGGQAKIAWSEGDCLIRDGSRRRPWKGADDDELRRRHLPHIDVQWLVGTKPANHAFVDWPNIDNEIRMEPKPAPTGIRLRLQQALLSAGDGGHANLDDGENAGRNAPSNPLVGTAASEIARLTSIQSLLKSIAPKPLETPRWGVAPERAANEVDIEVQIANLGQAKSGELHFTLCAPEGLSFVPYWAEMALLGRTHTIDFRTDEDGSQEVRLKRDSLLHGLCTSAKVRIRFEAPGEYLLRYSSAVEHLPGSVEGVLRLTVEM